MEINPVLMPIFALAGLRVPGVVIRDPRCVAKTWPGYFSALELL